MTDARCRTMVLVVVTGLLVAAATGCGNGPAPTGFLSDYSKLEPDNGSLRFIGPDVGRYNKFIVEPVTVYFHDEAAGAETDQAMLDDLANYFHNAIIVALSPRYQMVSQPAPGVARVRIALTDVDKGKPALNVLPQTKLMGLGLGGASMEGEMVDSMTGRQIGAVIQSRKGSRFSLAGIHKWGDAKAVMDDWAESFRKRLDEAHGIAN